MGFDELLLREVATQMLTSCMSMSRRRWRDIRLGELEAVLRLYYRPGGLTPWQSAKGLRLFLWQLIASHLTLQVPV